MAVFFGLLRRKRAARPFHPCNQHAGGNDARTGSGILDDGRQLVTGGVSVLGLGGRPNDRQLAARVLWGAHHHITGNRPDLRDRAQNIGVE